MVKLSTAPHGIAKAKRTPESGMQVSQGDVSQEVIDDWDAGLEYGEVAEVLKYTVRGDGKEYLVRWVPPPGPIWRKSQYKKQMLYKKDSTRNICCTRKAVQETDDVQERQYKKQKL